MYIREDSQVKLAIIGGGVAGITLSQLIQQDGQYRVNLYDKSRRLGGRASLVPIQDMQVPFAIGVKQCSINIERLKHSILTQEINLKQLLQDLGWQKKEESHENTLPASFELGTDTWVNLEQGFSANSLDNQHIHSLYLSHHIKSLCFDQSTQTWQIDGECWTGQQKTTFSHTANYVMLSLPPQQAHDLLQETCFKMLKTDLIRDEALVPEAIIRLKQRLEEVKAQSSWVLLLKIPLRLLNQIQLSALQDSIMIKSFKDLSMNLTQCQSSNSSVIAIHLHHDWSAMHVDLGTRQIEELCLAELKSLLSNPAKLNLSSVEVLRVHRWRYASSSMCDDEQQLYYSELNLGFCGEAMIKGQIDQGVERALLSALKLYSEINLST